MKNKADQRATHQKLENCIQKFNTKLGPKAKKQENGSKNRTNSRTKIIADIWCVSCQKKICKKYK